MKNLLLATENSSVKKVQNVAEKTKLLTNGENTSQDLNLIEALCGSDSPLIVANKNIGKIIEKDNHEKVYGTDIVSLNSIKKLSIKYNLRFARTNKYKGMLGFDVLDKIKEFGIATNTTVSSAVLERNFYVLTTNKSLEGKSNDVVILIYKIDNDFFKIIHTWGKLPSIFRLPIAAMYRNPKTLAIGIGVISMLSLSIILGLLIPIQTFLEEQVLLWLPQLFLGLVGWFISSLFIEDISSSKSKKIFSEKNWSYYES